MKKLLFAAVLSVFSVSAISHACDGMKGHEKSSDTNTQVKKQAKRATDTAKSDQKS